MKSRQGHVGLYCLLGTLACGFAIACKLAFVWGVDSYLYSLPVIGGVLASLEVAEVISPILLALLGLALGALTYYLPVETGLGVRLLLLGLALPLVLSALALQGQQDPVEELLSQLHSANPQILTAAIVFGIGWLVAKIVKGIVTNLLMATGADRFGARFGLAARPDTGISVSSLAGILVYTLILIPAAIAALNELNIEAISGPAVDMLERVLFIIPQVLAAGAVLAVFYFIGQFVSDLLVSLLSSLGFDNITSILGLPELSTAPDLEPVVLAEGEPMPAVEPPRKTPSEIVCVIALVGIVLFGAVTATEILDFPVLTNIVQSILAVSVRVLSGIIVFAIGLYAANLAFRLIDGMGMTSSGTLAQAARIAIIAFVGAMALQQMGVATSIVNLAFGLLLGAIAVAIAIAFGLGGRDVAADNLREWVNHLKQ